MSKKVYCGIAVDVLLRRRHYKVLVSAGTTRRELQLALDNLPADAQLDESYMEDGNNFRLMFFHETIETKEVV